MEEEREADRFVANQSDDHFSEAPLAEQGFTKPKLCGHDLVGELLVLGERLDNPEDDGNVGCRRRLDAEVDHALRTPP